MTRGHRIQTSDCKGMLVIYAPLNPPKAWLLERGGISFVRWPAEEHAIMEGLESGYKVRLQG